MENFQDRGVWTLIRTLKIHGSGAGQYQTGSETLGSISKYFVMLIVLCRLREILTSSMSTAVYQVGPGAGVTAGVVGEAQTHRDVDVLGLARNLHSQHLIS